MTNSKLRIVKKITWLDTVSARLEMIMRSNDAQKAHAARVEWQKVNKIIRLLESNLGYC